MRCVTDSVVLWEFFQHFKFKNFLEIGIYEGATGGLIWEANEKEISLTGIDIVPIKNNVFKKIYPDAKRNDYLSDSSTFNFSQLPNFDLILIDGDHNYEYVVSDIKNSLLKISNNGVIILDDKDLTGVNNSKFLLKDADFVPFLELQQCELWHHKSNDRSAFLDHLVFESSLRTFLYIENKVVDDYTVTQVKSNWIFNEDLEIANIIMRKYT
jgi:hypothetical protein